MVLPVDIGNAFIERARAMGWHLRLRTDMAETEPTAASGAAGFLPTAGSVSATGWRSAGQSSNIRKALPL